MPKIENGVIPKVTFIKAASKQLKCPVVVYADFEAMNVKYKVPEGNKMKILTKHIATMGCCTVVYTDGTKETVTFRNTDDKPCYVALLEYLNELSLTIKMNYIDHELISPDWRHRKDLTYDQKKLLVEWLKLHESKNVCDICHDKFTQFCDACDKKCNDKDFKSCESCAKKGANGNKHYDHCHFTGKYRSTACHTCNTRRISFNPNS